jgi:hypothetical protein
MTEVSQMTHDEHHSALVRRLAAEVKPTRRLWSVGVRLAPWIALEVGASSCGSRFIPATISCRSSNSRSMLLRYCFLPLRR